MPNIRNPNIKRANLEQDYTSHQIMELKRCAMDPVHMISNYVMIQHPLKGSILFDPYDYQENIVHTYQNNKDVIILSSRQTGKSLSINEKIPTPTGWSTMGELSVGDLIMGSDGNPTKIISKTDTMHDHECYDVIFDSGDKITADRDHLWRVIDSIFHSEFTLTTEQLLKFMGIGISFYINKGKPLNLPEVDLPISEYDFGVYLGVKHSVQTKVDINTLNRLFLQPINRLSQSREILKQILRASYKQRLMVVRGLTDVCGYINENGKYELTLLNDKVSYNICELLVTLGITPTIKETTDSNACNVIEFVANDSEMTYTLDHRHLDYTHTQFRIEKIEKVNSVPVQCIVVDNKDHMFLVGNSMIPTHNSITTAAYLLWFAMFNFDKTILIASNKNSNAMEMVFRIRFAYENLPLWLKPGVEADGWNKHNVHFDNGSRIISTATSEDSGRSMSISCVEGETLITVRRKSTGEMLKISIEDFCKKLMINTKVNSSKNNKEQNEKFISQEQIHKMVYVTD